MEHVCVIDMNIILDQKLAKEIIYCALGMKMKRSVINFFSKHHHPDMGFLSEYMKYSTKVEIISKILNIDWLFYNFIESDFRCTSFLQSIYHWTITSPEYYWDKRPDDYLACVKNLNDILFFREIVGKEIIKIVGYPKRVNVKWSRYRYYPYGPFRVKHTHCRTTYGEDFRSTASKVIKNLSTGRHVHKIHRIKIYDDHSWNVYSPNFYRAYINVMNKVGVSPVLNTKLQ